MVTKRTRLISGLVAILMLVSMFTAFVLPVTADAATAPEVSTSADTGLADARNLTDITAYSSDCKAYQVQDLAGMKKLMELVLTGTAMSGVTIYQTCDIDMESFPFAGIGSKSKPFSGTFDGNGFVIKNLYVLRNDEGASGAGLFGGIKGATIKNVGIASGIVVGRDVTGAVVGAALNGDTANTIVNCWNAATVVGSFSNGTGGIVGRMYAGTTLVENCYNLGLVYNSWNRAAGIVGWVEAGTGNNVINCYNAGEIVSGFYSTYGDELKYAAVLSGSTGSAIGTRTANNYYIKGRGTTGSMKDLGKTLNDQATGKDAAALTDGSLVKALNGAGLNSYVADWALAYQNTDAGYPVLTYSKTVDAESEPVVIQHTADAAAMNVNGAQDWAAKSDLFANMVAKKNGNFSGGAKLSDLRLKSADDLFIYGMITIGGNASNRYKSIFGNGYVYLEADVDMDDQTICAGAKYYVPICSGGGIFDGVFNGQNHVIYNWHVMVYNVDGNENGGLFPVVYNATISNLGMVKAENVYKKLGGGGYNYPALMVERVYNSSGIAVTMSNCFATGTLHVWPNMVNTNNNGGVFSTTWYSVSKFSKCWADTDVINYNADGTVSSTGKARVIGKVPDTNATSITSCYYIADTEPVLTRNGKKVTLTGGDYYYGTDNGAWYHLRNGRLSEKNYSTKDGSLAIFLNQNNIQSVTVKNGETVFKNAGDEMYQVSLLKMINDETGYLVEGSAYYAPGEEVTVPATLSGGYESPYGDQEITFTMPNQDVDVCYTADGFDSALAQELVEKYGNGQYDFNLFENGAAMEKAYTAAKAAVEANNSGDTATATAKLAEAAEYANLVGEPDLLMEEGYYPPYSKKSVYEKLLPCSSGSIEWGISSYEDWEAIAADSKTMSFANYTFHFNNDVDMGGKETTPIAANYSGGWKAFQGIIHGHGHKILNLNINWNVANGRYVGLVGYGSGAAIRDLTIENGSVVAYGNVPKEYDSSSKTNVEREVMVGGFIAEGYRCYVVNCRNNANIDATKAYTSTGEVTDNQTVSGIARLTNTSVIDSCINTGDVSSNGYSYGISGYAQGTTYVVNCYSTGKLTGARTGLARYNSNWIAKGFYDNSYIVENDFCQSLTFADEAEHELTDEQVANSELAGRLNQNYVAMSWRSNAAYGSNTRTYFTIDENGETVWGTSSDMTRTVAMECEGHETKYLYGEKGDVVTLNYSENATYKLKTSGTYDPETKTVTIGGADVVLAVTCSDLLYDRLTAAVDSFAGAGVEVYSTEGVEDFAAYYAEVQKKLEEKSYTSQAEIDADVAKLEGANCQGLSFERPSYATYSNSNLLITSLYDLEMLANIRGGLASGSTVHIMADIEVPAGSAAQNLSGLKANINAYGHTIKGLSINGWLGNYVGSYVKNINFEDCVAPSLGWCQGLLINVYGGSNLLLENISFKNCTATKKDSNGQSLMVGGSDTGDTITYRNISIEGCTLNNGNGGFGNGGFLGGRMNSNVVVENVMLNNNTFAGPSTWGLGLVFGELVGNGSITDVSIANTAIPDGKLNGVLIGTYKGSNNKLTVSRVAAYGNDANDRVINHDGAQSALSVELVYSAESANIVTGKSTMANNKDQVKAALANGDAAAAMNESAEDDVWTVKDGETVLLAFNEDANPMTVVTFMPEDVESAIMDESDYTTTLYADSDGKILKLDSIKDELNKRGYWNWEAIEADTYSADHNVVYGTPIPAHEHVFECTQAGDGEHTATCTWSNGSISCTWYETQNCEYTEKVTCDDLNADHEHATHTGECVCGREATSVACNPTGTVTKAATCEEDGIMTYVCTTCGYVHDEVIEKYQHQYTEFVADTKEDGSFKGTHTKTCTNDGCESSVTENCDFSGETEEIPATNTATGEKRTYCTECDAYEVTEVIPALAHLVAEPELGYIGEQMEVVVKVKNNPGFSGVVMDITYDPAVIDLNKVELLTGYDHEYLPDELPTAAFSTKTNEDNTETARTALTLYAKENFTGENLLKLTFDVVDDTNNIGVYSNGLKITVNDAADYDTNTVTIGAWEGDYEVVDIIRGDADRDCYVTIADAILMVQKLGGKDVVIDEVAADVVGDEAKFDTNDVSAVLKYLNREEIQFKSN